jgi:hypothetical protein
VFTLYCSRNTTTLHAVSRLDFCEAIPAFNASYDLFSHALDWPGRLSQSAIYPLTIVERRTRAQPGRFRCNKRVS